MLIDTDGGTVEFCHEVLDAPQLRAILLLLSDGTEPDLPALEKAVLPVINGVNLDAMLTVREIDVYSETRAGVVYHVKEFLDGHLTCDCPDFIQRDKAASGDTCKHIRRALRLDSWVRTVYL